MQSYSHPHVHPAEGVIGVRVAAQDVIALVGRALAEERFPELGFADPYAGRVLAQLDVDAAAWEDSVLRAAVVRTMLFDDLARDFFRRHRSSPGAEAPLAPLGIGFFSGLCTRFSRVDDGASRWLDVEHADMAQILADAQPARERQTISCSCSVACRGWMRHVREHVAQTNTPVLVVVQGGLVGAPRGMLDAFLTNVSQVLPTGSEIVADFDARAPIRPRGRSLEAMNDDEAWVRYPRLRFLFHGRGVPALAHLRVA